MPATIWVRHKQNKNCSCLECLDTGGGVALLYASKSLDAVKEKLENFDQTVGVQILQTALRVPLKTIADNAGELHLPVSVLSLVMHRQLCMCQCCF